MSRTVAESVAWYDLVIAVSNVGLDLAPWAHALCAQDFSWWRQHPEAKKFKGQKFSANKIDGVEQVDSPLIARGSSSGVLALEVARRLGGTHIELYGYENHNRNGCHYFGKHPEPLRNTSDSRFRVFEDQLRTLGLDMQKKGIKIVNKTPDSDLKCFPHG